MHDEALWDVWFPQAVEITAAGVRDFARAVRCWHVPHESPLVLPAQAGTAPATLGASALLSAATVVVARAIPGRNLARVLHVEQSFAYDRHPRVGDVLDVGARLTRRTSRGAVALLTIDAVLAADGRTRVRSSSTIAYDGSELGTADLAFEDVAESVMRTGSGPGAATAANFGN
ncbi:FAS1-like dehydratase domain-containing protein [Tsukamurella sputi]|uniref:FAS1-like dehydratase domain-containing protein n=1 Tax=Tsukamurella sputi TaxID=2591848 RepID=UPI001315A39F|nr:MaoC family dehydratase N-terminal domain-containing protein [Tsukamurella sputi]